MKKNGVEESQELCLIDVSFEDDSLIQSSPQQDNRSSEGAGRVGKYNLRKSLAWDNAFLTCAENQEEHAIVESVKALEAGRTKDTAEAFERKEHPLQSCESTKLEKARAGKCNLRKSLAWDSAFFTSAGVLDAEELSSMIDGVQSCNHLLPAISEDLRQSTDSISTIESDNLILEGIEEDNLFQDIRASIQKSNKATNLEILNEKSESSERETHFINSKNGDLASRNKIKAKPLLKNSSHGIQGTMRTAKQGSASQLTQLTAKHREPTSSFSRPPKVLGRSNSISTVQTKRASFSTSHNKVEIDNGKGITSKGVDGKHILLPKIPCMNDSHSRGAGKGAPVSKLSTLSNSRGTLSRPKRPSASNCAVSPTKMGSIHVRSSVDSYSSASSNKSTKSPINSQKRHTDSKPSSGAISKTPSIASARYKTQLANLTLSAYLKSMPKTSSVSPASSISEWSFESSSSTSNVNRLSINSRSSLESISFCKGINVDNHGDKNRFSHGQKNQRMEPSSQTVNRTSVEKRVPASSASTKPSGLKLPAPKIGFFDGVKLGEGTPKRDAQSPSGLQIRLAKITTPVSSPVGTSNKLGLAKVQPKRTVISPQNVKIDTQETTLNLKTAPVQHAIISKTRLSGVLTTGFHDISELPNHLSPEIGDKSRVKSENDITEEPAPSVNFVSDSVLSAEGNDNVDSLKNKAISENLKCSISLQVQSNLSCKAGVDGSPVKADSCSTEGHVSPKFISEFHLNAKENRCKDGQKNEIIIENVRYADLEDIAYIEKDGHACESDSGSVMENIDATQKVVEKGDDIEEQCVLKNIFYLLDEMNEKIHLGDQFEEWSESDVYLKENVCDFEVKGNPFPKPMERNYLKDGNSCIEGHSGAKCPSDSDLNGALTENVDYDRMQDNTTIKTDSSCKSTVIEKTYLGDLNIALQKKNASSFQDVRSLSPTLMEESHLMDDNSCIEGHTAVKYLSDSDLNEVLTENLNYGHIEDTTTTTIKTDGSCKFNEIEKIHLGELNAVSQKENVRCCKVERNLSPEPREEIRLKEEYVGGHGIGKFPLNFDLNVVLTENVEDDHFEVNTAIKIDGSCKSIENLGDLNIGWQKENVSCKPMEENRLKDDSVSNEGHDTVKCPSDLDLNEVFTENVECFHLEDNATFIEIDSLCKSSEEETHIGNQIEDLSKLLGAVNLSMELKKDIGNSHFRPDLNIGAVESQCCEEPLISCVQKDEFVDVLSKLGALSLSETADVARIPLASKKLVCNSCDELLDLPKSSANEVEKHAMSLSLDDGEKENV